jgi:hypothetical protein
VKRLLRALRRAATGHDPAAQDSLADAVDALRAEVADLRHEAASLRAHVQANQEATAQLVATYRADVADRVRLAAPGRAQLLSDRIVLDAPLARRLDVTRLTHGRVVERSAGELRGLVRVTTTDPHVRTLWEALSDAEATAGAAPRGLPATLLDVPAAVVSTDAGNGLRISVGGAAGGAAASRPVVAVPKFTYDFAERKTRNFGHWLLDCLPQIAALTAAAPEAAILLPPPIRGFHRSTVALLGIPQDRLVAWDGAPLACGRVLVVESDGRAGGRPLASLLEMRASMVARGIAAASPGERRIYVSRRDARAKRRWLSNEPEVERLFMQRGFEIMVMGECPLDEQIRRFREARIIAGISGAGLADLVFSAPGAHLVVLLSDGLLSWYADEEGARSLWLRAADEGRDDRPVRGDSPHFYVHLAAAFGQPCHCFVGPDALPLDELAAFTDEVLALVGAERTS